MKVVIIGAGIAGLSIGWRLAQSGAETLILDRAQPGQGATWASGGMLAAIAETSGGAPEAEAAFARKSLGLWASFAEELEQASGRALSYRQEGLLFVASDEAEACDLRNRAAVAGVPFVSAEEARAQVPGLRNGIAGALWAPDEAQVDNRAIGRALSSAYLKAGGTLSANETAVRVETRDNGRVAVLTPFTLHEADAVILAAGAWTGRIEGLADATPAVHPVKGELIALRPPDASDLPRPLVWGKGAYLVPRGPRLFVGATVSEAGYDTSVTTEACDWLLERASALMPGLKDWPIEEQWAGLRPASPDGLPLIGETAIPSVFVASGQYRNGILFAPLLAETVRTLVLERTVPPEIAAFDPKRFQK